LAAAGLGVLVRNNCFLFHDKGFRSVAQCSDTGVEVKKIANGVKAILGGTAYAALKTTLKAEIDPKARKKFHEPSYGHMRNSATSGDGRRFCRFGRSI
jgi:hypothetical protein